MFSAPIGGLVNQLLSQLSGPTSGPTNASLGDGGAGKMYNSITAQRSSRTAANEAAASGSTRLSTQDKKY